MIKLVSIRNPAQAYFVNYSFFEDLQGILRECQSVSNLGFIMYNLSWDSLDKLLYSNNSYNDIDVLDLTRNELDKNPEDFVDVLHKAIAPFKSIEVLILSYNWFDEKYYFFDQRSSWL